MRVTLPRWHRWPAALCDTTDASAMRGTARSFYGLLLTMAVLIAVGLGADMGLHATQGALSTPVTRFAAVRNRAQQTLSAARAAGLPLATLQAALNTPAPSHQAMLMLLILGNRSAAEPWTRRIEALTRAMAALQPDITRWQAGMGPINAARTSAKVSLRHVEAVLPQLQATVRKREHALSWSGPVPLGEQQAVLRRLQQTTAWAGALLTQDSRDYQALTQAQALLTEAAALHASKERLSAAFVIATRQVTTATTVSQLTDAVVPLVAAEQPVVSWFQTQLVQARRTARSQLTLLAVSAPPLQARVESKEQRLPLAGSVKPDDLAAAVQQMQRAASWASVVATQEQQARTTLQQAQELLQQAVRLHVSPSGFTTVVGTAQQDLASAATKAAIQAAVAPLPSAEQPVEAVINQELAHTRAAATAALERVAALDHELSAAVQTDERTLPLQGSVALSQEDTAISALQGAVTWANDCASEYRQAQAALTKAQQILTQATPLHIQVGALPSVLKTAQQQLAAAASVSQMQAAVAPLTKAELSPRVELRAALPGPGKVIVVHLQAQTLTAYQNGTKVLTTPVTTGRKHLRTPIGIDTITWHASPYVFISPWPKSSPFWYPRSKVKWVMHFHSEGYFIHDAPWEPNSVYGPGSENGPDASHGCVQVPHAAMKFLYTWTPNGTTVVIAP